MPLFKITYQCPETYEIKEVIKSFEDSIKPNTSAREWAEDYAYTIADKGFHKVEEVDS